MAGIRHDVLVLALKDNPALLSTLLERLQSVSLPGPLQPVDSVVRFTGALETTPDIVFTTPDPTAPWVIAEVQNRRDETKGKTWDLATSALLQHHGMGDLIVITASRAVARWAVTASVHRGRFGTRKGLVPVVLHLSRKELVALLDPTAPQLALFAVWARCRGGGSEAKQVLERALELTDVLPPPLREAQTRAILAMLGQRLRDYLQEMAMDLDKIPEPKASRAFRLFFENRGKAEGLAEGKAEGKAEGLTEGKRASLLTVLVARGLTPSAAERKRIAAVDDADLLDECVRCAVTATTVAEALAPLGRVHQPAPRKGRPRRASPAKPETPAKKINSHRR
jgi:hypothetical protein